MKKNNKIFGNASVILICGPSSAGKSTLANLICELCPNFLKLNTKDFRNKNKRIHNIGKSGVINMKMINNNKKK